MDYETVDADQFGRSLGGIGFNLLCRDLRREAAFLTVVFGMTAHRLSTDFAIMTHEGQPFQLHSDGTFASHPLAALLPETPPRGAGIELRLFGIDPDAACQRAAHHPEALILQTPRDKAAHGLREAVILSPEGYAWVPSVHLRRPDQG